MMPIKVTQADADNFIKNADKDKTLDTELVKAIVGCPVSLLQALTLFKQWIGRSTDSRGNLLIFHYLNKISKDGMIDVILALLTILAEEGKRSHIKEFPDDTVYDMYRDIFVRATDNYKIAERKFFSND